MTQRAFDTTITEPGYKAFLSLVPHFCSRRGFVPLDCGPLGNARYVEAITMPNLKLAFGQGMGIGIAFKAVGLD